MYNVHVLYNDYYILLQVVETLIMRGSPICIEVNGMPKVRSQDLHDEEDGLMDLGEEDCLLIEKWVLQIINLKGRLANTYRCTCVHYMYIHIYSTCTTCTCKCEQTKDALIIG